MKRERAKFAPAEATEVLSHYDIGAVREAKEFPRGSHSAAKLIIGTDERRYLLKRRPSHDVDPFRVAFSHSLQRYLASKNFPLPHLIGTRDDNNSMCKLGDRIYELYEFIEGEPFSEGLVATYESGKTLGIYHSLVSKFQSEYAPPRGHYHDSRMVYTSFRPIGERLVHRPGKTVRSRDIVALLKKIRRLYRLAAEAVNRLGLGTWPSQIVHSDWHPGNLLFQKEHVVAVIDYDSARIRPRVMDVANACLQFSMVTGGRDLATWEARTDFLRAKRFLRGYDEVNVLSRAELDAVPHLMQEVLIAQAVQPILRTGTFAGLDGYEFLKIILAKMEWLRLNTAIFSLDSGED